MAQGNATTSQTQTAKPQVRLHDVADHKGDQAAPALNLPQEKLAQIQMERTDETVWRDFLVMVKDGADPAAMNPHTVLAKGDAATNANSFLVDLAPAVQEITEEMVFASGQMMKLDDLLAATAQSANVSQPVVAAAPTNADIVALQNILANMEPAAGGNGGGAGGAGHFNSSIDAVSLLGLGRLGALDPTDWGSGLNGRDLHGIVDGLQINTSITSADDSGATDNLTLTTTGNVLTNDLGAGVLTLTSIAINGLTVAIPATGTVDIVGAHGRLTIAANGDYTFIANDKANGPDVFTYTVVDQDNNTNTATLTIVTNDGVPVGVDDTSTAVGTLDVATQAVTGVLHMDAAHGVLANDTHGDGVQSVNLIGSSVGNFGILNLNADGSYTYSINSSKMALQGSPSDTFTYQVIDEDGDVTQAVLTISIGSDGTWTTNNSVPVAVGGEILNSFAQSADTGSLLVNETQRGDGVLHLNTVTIGGVTHTISSSGLVLDTAEYHLEINQDGTYTLTGKAGINSGDIPMAYTVVDGDGDVSNTAVAIIRIGDSYTGTIPTPGNDNANVSSLGVITGDTNILANDIGDGSLRVTMVNGVPVPASGSVDIVLLNGVLSVSANGSYTFAAVNGMNQTVSVAYTVVDMHGDPASATLTITTNDQLVTATNDIGSVDGHLNVATQMVSAVLTTDAAHGVLANDIGGDGVKTATLNGNGTGVFGTLVLHADGSYVYTLNASKTALQGNPSETFTYTITDVDGDTSTATITISIGSDGSWSTNNSLPIANDDIDAATGHLNIATQTVTGTINRDAAHGVLANDTGGDGTKTAHLVGSTQGAYGTLTLNSDGSYTYSLSASKTSLQGSPVEHFTYQVVDADGDVSQATLTITIGSDGSWTTNNSVPVAIGETDDVVGSLNMATQKVTGTISDSVLANGDQMGDNPSTVSLVGSTQGQFGTITLNADGTYTYVLNANKSALTGNPVEHFTYQITDADGDTSTAVLNITVSSDGSWTSSNLTPTAVNDSGTSVGEAAIHGDILSNDIAGNGALTLVSIRNMATGQVYNLSAGAVITTANGTLTINADGTYTYKGADDKNGTDTFQYTVRDADGDTSTATLTLTASDSTPVGVNDSAAVSGHLNIANQTVTGTINRDAAHGVLSNDTGGDGVKTVQLVSSAQGAHGILTLNADGSYSYALSDAKTSLQGSPTDTFTYQVTDADGDTSTATLTITIGSDGSWSTSNLSPTARDDSATSRGEIAVSGNVLGNDTGGNGTTSVVSVRDLATGIVYNIGTGQTISLANGTLTINADGSYSYKGRDDANGTDQIRYTIVDSDGDTSTATLYLNAADSAPAAENDSVSSSANVVSGAVMANDHASADGGTRMNSVTFQGQTQTVANGGSVTFNVNGFVLVVKSDGTFTLTNSNQSVQNPSFTYNLIDVDGDVSNNATSSMSVGAFIPNLLPEAHDDSIATNNTTLSKSGNLITNDNQGDGPARIESITYNGTTYNIPVNGWQKITLDGGATLTVASDGSYSMAANNAATGSANVTYTMVDSNGDHSSANIAVSWHDAVTSAVNDSASLSGHLDVSTQAVTGTITRDAAHGVLANDDKGDGGATAVIIGNPQGNYGTLTLNSDGSYTYTLNASKAALQGSPTETFMYQIADADGDTSIATLTITIGSDGSWTTSNHTPTARSDSNSSTGGANMNGNVMSNDTGGDGSTTVSHVNGQVVSQGSSITGSYGTLYINPDGGYTYVPNNGATGTDKFTYTIRDADGDTSSTTLTLSTADAAPTARNDSNSSTGGANMNGNVMSNDSGGDGSTTVSHINGQAVSQGSSISGSYGTLYINPDGGYTYVPNNGATGTDNFTYTIRDADGDTSSATLSVSTADALPTARNDSNSSTAGANMSGYVMANDTGGDGTTTVSHINGGAVSWGTSISGTYGTLYINPDGGYTYVPKNGATGTDSFTYTIKDADGDTSTATLSLSTADALPTARNDSNSSANGATVGGYIMSNDTAGDGVTLVTSVSGQAISANGMTNITGTYGVLHIASDGTYTYTPNGGANGTDSFSYTIKDSDGDTSTATLTIGVTPPPPPPPVDLLPVAVNDTGAAQIGGSSVGGNIMANDTKGDGVTSVTFISGGTGWFGMPNMAWMSGTTTINGNYGVLTINPDGSYSYAPNGNSPFFAVPGTDTFSYTITDADGDTSTANLSFNITSYMPPTVDHTPVASDDSNSSVGGAAMSGNITWNDESLDGGKIINTINGIAVPSNIAVGNPFVIQGTYGTLYVGPDGAYNYILKNGAGYGTDTFTYTIRDNDGDVSNTATLTLSSATPTPFSASNDDATLYISRQLSSGASSTSINLLSNDGGSGLTVTAITVPGHNSSLGWVPAQTYNIPAGGLTLSVDVSDGQTSSQQTISISPNGSFNVSYANFGDTPGAGGGLNYTYTVKDSVGHTTTATVSTGVVYYGGGGSPLVLDIDGNGHIDLTPIHHGVQFDITNDGVKDQIGWVAPTDGLLALDLNHNGIIDNQNELFGSPVGSPLEVNGFTKLAQYDENHDNLIDKHDAIWSSLVVWRDANQDGISQADEMVTLDAVGVLAISLHAVQTDYTITGNFIYWEGTFVRADGSTGQIVDAYFLYNDGAQSTSAPATTPSTPVSGSGHDLPVDTSHNTDVKVDAPIKADGHIGNVDDTGAHTVDPIRVTVDPVHDLDGSLTPILVAGHDIGGNDIVVDAHAIQQRDPGTVMIDPIRADIHGAPDILITAGDLIDHNEWPTVPPVAIERVVTENDLDGAILNTLQDHLSASQTEDLDAAIHAFLVQSSGDTPGIAAPVIEQVPMAVMEISVHPIQNPEEHL